MMNRVDAAEIVAILVAAYPQAQVSTQTSEVYERMLLDLDRDVAHRAVCNLVRTSKWMPTVADICAEVVTVQCGPGRIGAEAWGDVLAEIRRVGSYGDPKFKDPLVGECVRGMGWRQLCLSENDAADRARFIEFYEGLQTRQRRETQMGVARLPSGSEVLQLAGKVKI